MGVLSSQPGGLPKAAVVVYYRAMPDIRTQAFGGRDGTQTAAATVATAGPEFVGRSGELWIIIIINFLLTVVTLGIWRFWGRTRIRRYLWSHTEYQGDAAEYTGTGGELFVGFLIVFFAILLPLSIVFGLLSQWLTVEQPELAALVPLVFNFLILYLIGIALYRARRYRLSRSTWRGIRFAQTGSSFRFAWLFIGYVVTGVLTLGLALPFWHLKHWSFRWNNTWFGNRPFSFAGPVGPLYKPFIISWLLFLPTLGFSYAWYKAAAFEHLARHTRYEGQGFEFTIAPGRLIGFLLLNLLLVVVTLGLGQPITQLRAVRLITEHIGLPAGIDFEAIAQSAAERPEIGEGLADAFDVGAV